MNAAQIHLLFNHWPLVLLFIGFCVLLAGEWKLNISYKELGLDLLIAAAIFTVPTLMSGEGAEHILMELNLADHDVIEKHEGFGFWTAMLVYLIGILSFISLIMIHNMHALFGGIRKLILILSVAAFILMGITSHLGAEIRHSEIKVTVTE